MLGAVEVEPETPVSKLRRLPIMPVMPVPDDVPESSEERVVPPVSAPLRANDPTTGVATMAAGAATAGCG